MSSIKKYAIPAICIFNILIHLSSIFFMEFHRDELLYFSLSNHLDLGYASVPPMVSWIAWLAKSIFGFSPFAVKIFPALLSGAFIYLSAAVAKELKGGFYSQLLTAIALTCTPLVLRAFILFQPVPFDIFFWTLTLFIVLKYINTEDQKWLYYLGLTLGIAVLNKYLILFLLAVIIGLLPFTKHRNLFTKKAFYASIGIAILIASPNIYWQISNDFPVLAHMNELEETQLQYVSKWNFIQGQMLMFFTSFFIAVAGLISLLSSQKYRIFGFTAFGVFLLLMFMSAKDYYAAGIYPFLIAAGAVAIENKITKKWLRSSIITIIILLIIPLLPAGIPFMSPEALAIHFDKLDSWGIGTNRVHEDGETHRLPQDYADMLGWYEISDYTHQAFEKAQNKDAIAIFGENYGIAGAVSLINKKYGMSEAVSFSDTYEYWAPESFDPDIKSFIYINDELGGNVEALFENIEIIGVVSDSLSRQYGVTVYLCENPRRSFNEFWSEVWEYVRAN